jgi:hypothetical protein
MSRTSTLDFTLDLVRELLVHQNRYLPPSILVQSYAWIAGNRQQRTGEHVQRSIAR